MKEPTSRVNKTKSRNILLLTSDPEFEKIMQKALHGEGTTILLSHSITDALQTVCSRGRELDIAVIDFTEGCHGMTLLRALKACRVDLPIIVVTSSDFYHAAELAYANGVKGCLAKPVDETELKLVVEELQSLKPLLNLA